MKVEGCKACAGMRLHTEEDRALHPHAGHGYTKEGGWTRNTTKPSCGEKGCPICDGD